MIINMTELRDQREPDVPNKHPKQWFNEATVDITVDGVEYKDATAWIGGGKVYDAGIAHNDLPEDKTDIISSWWYGVNFGYVEYDYNTDTDPDDAMEKGRAKVGVS